MVRGVHEGRIHPRVDRFRDRPRGPEVPQGVQEEVNPMDVLMERISVRDFTDEPVSDSDLESILRAAMQAPSARNQQAWEFLVVDDPS
ncbi:MAG: nitroreductase family protein, partial [Candidatus Methanomethylophilaceae archaeon]|nr:nitroreductase family protein [Candidatus Methanomethylophilaceae archaeon]